MKEKILVVDDEEIIRDTLTYVLKEEGYQVDQAMDGSDALSKVEKNEYDLIITDIKMPKMDGMQLLEKVRATKPDTFMVVITAFASIESAVGALRLGAYDYMIKPLDFDEVISKVKRLFEHSQLARENRTLRQELHRKYDFSMIIGKSPRMKDVFNLIEKVAQTEGTVLVTGKTGTGKELVARAIHYNGIRRRHSFVAVNCGAIVETLIESELFGHVKGSFTGAVKDKKGLFAVADKGTLFLDEISEMPLHLQVKLLRALEAKEITPVGGTEPLSINVRIIAATNKNIKQEVDEGRFREDLYYRLNVLEINLPSLDERKEDIGLLVQHFIDKYNMEMNKNISEVDERVMQALRNHSWRGEVRELENIIERAMIFADTNRIELEDLPQSMQGSPDGGETDVPRNLSDALSHFEKEHIIKELKLTGWDKKTASKNLDISLSSLYRKMEQYRIVSQS